MGLDKATCIRFSISQVNRLAGSLIAIAWFRSLRCLVIEVTLVSEVGLIEFASLEHPGCFTSLICKCHLSNVQVQAAHHNLRSHCLEQFTPIEVIKKMREFSHFTLLLCLQVFP